MDDNDGSVRFRNFRFAGHILDYFLGRTGMRIRQGRHAKLRGGNCHCRRAKKPPTTVVDFLRHDFSNPRAVSAIALPCLPLFGSTAKLVTAYRDFFHFAVLARVAVQPKA